MRFRIRSFVVSCVAAVTSATAHCSEPAATDLDAAVAAYPTVITPTGLRQSLQDVPASVTVITSQQLRAFGIGSIPDALRLVPGMVGADITQQSAGSYKINYHGTNAHSPRRLNVLIDGVPVYVPRLSEIFWANLPIAVEDIERIEVTRGPDSAAYGPNSMAAVINIFTKKASDAPRGLVSVGGGSNGMAHAYARTLATVGDTALLFSVSTERDGGYDHIYGREGHDTSSARRLMFRSETPVSAQSQLSLQAAYVEGIAETMFMQKYLTTPDRKLRDAYVGAAWTQKLSPVHELQTRVSYSHHAVDQRWIGCVPQAMFLPQLYTLYSANPGYANAVAVGQVPTGGTPQDDLLASQAAAAIIALGVNAQQPACVEINQDRSESRSDLEIRDTYVVSDALRLVAGVGARQQKADSQTFLAGSTSNTLFRAFGNLEYRPAAWLGLNAGGFAERDQIVGSTFSPRIAANLHVDGNQSFRAVLSKGTRSPDLAEQRSNISYAVDLPTPGVAGSTTSRFYQHATSAGGLRSEKELSRELGYLLNLPRWGLVFDAKLFSDQLRDLISEPIDVSTVTPTNSNSVDLRGAEFQLNATLSPKWMLFATYAYLDNLNASTPLERLQYSRHSGGLGVAHGASFGWHSSVAYMGTSGDGMNSATGRWDFTLGRGWTVGSRAVDASLRLSRLDSPSVTYYSGGAQLDSRVLAYAQMRVSF